MHIRASGQYSSDTDTSSYYTADTISQENSPTLEPIDGPSTVQIVEQFSSPNTVMQEQTAVSLDTSINLDHQMRQPCSVDEIEELVVGNVALSIEDGDDGDDHVSYSEDSDVKHMEEDVLLIEKSMRPDENMTNDMPYVDVKDESVPSIEDKSSDILSTEPLADATVDASVGVDFEDNTVVLVNHSEGSDVLSTKDEDTLSVEHKDGHVSSDEIDDGNDSVAESSDSSSIETSGNNDISIENITMVTTVDTNIEDTATSTEPKDDTLFSQNQSMNTLFTGDIVNHESNLEDTITTTKADDSDVESYFYGLFDVDDTVQSVSGNESNESFAIRGREASDIEIEDNDASHFEAEKDNAFPNSAHTDVNDITDNNLVNTSVLSGNSEEHDTLSVSDEGATDQAIITEDNMALDVENESGDFLYVTNEDNDSYDETGYVSSTESNENSAASARGRDDCALSVENKDEDALFYEDKNDDASSIKIEDNDNQASTRRNSDASLVKEKDSHAADSDESTDTLLEAKNEVSSVANDEVPNALDAENKISSISGHEESAPFTKDEDDGALDTKDEIGSSSLTEIEDGTISTVEKCIDVNTVIIETEAKDIFAAASDKSSEVSYTDDKKEHVSPIEHEVSHTLPADTENKSILDDKGETAIPPKVDDEGGCDLLSDAEDNNELSDEDADNTSLPAKIENNDALTANNGVTDIAELVVQVEGNDASSFKDEAIFSAVESKEITDESDEDDNELLTKDDANMLVTEEKSDNNSVTDSKTDSILSPDNKDNDIPVMDNENSNNHVVNVENSLVSSPTVNNNTFVSSFNNSNAVLDMEEKSDDVPAIENRDNNIPSIEIPDDASDDKNESASELLTTPHGPFSSPSTKTDDATSSISYANDAAALYVNDENSDAQAPNGAGITSLTANTRSLVNSTPSTSNPSATVSPSNHTIVQVDEPEKLSFWSRLCCKKKRRS
jgi:hypothetical protein